MIANHGQQLSTTIGGKDRYSVPLSNLDEVSLPVGIDGVEFVDLSDELDAHIGYRAVREVKMYGRHEVIEDGRTLREVIQARAFIMPMVTEYTVGGYDGDSIPVHYFLDTKVTIVGDPDGAERKGCSSLASLMRNSGYLGIIIPSIEGVQTRLFYPETDRIISVKTTGWIGGSLKTIGPVVGIRRMESRPAPQR